MGTRPATIPIRVKPGSSRTRVGGSYPGPYGPALVVAVHARAVEGAATAAAVKAVAEALGLRSRQVAVTAGHSSRDKLLLVEPAPIGLNERVATLMAATA